MGLNKFLTPTVLAKVENKILNHVPIIIKNGDILNEYGKMIACDKKDCLGRVLLFRYFKTKKTIN